MTGNDTGGEFSPDIDCPASNYKDADKGLGLTVMPGTLVLDRGVRKVSQRHNVLAQAELPTLSQGHSRDSRRQISHDNRCKRVS